MPGSEALKRIVEVINKLHPTDAILLTFREKYFQDKTRETQETQ